MLQNVAILVDHTVLRVTPFALPPPTFPFLDPPSATEYRQSQR